MLDLAELRLRLDSMTLRVFSNLNYSQFLSKIRFTSLLLTKYILPSHFKEKDFELLRTMHSQ